MTDDKDARGQFTEGNAANLRHGGERAVKALQKGSSLVGIARELQADVHDQIEREGVLAVLRESAERHQAVANLFYGLILGADNVEDADRYVQRFGWMNSKAFRMLETVHKMQTAGGDADVIDAALAAAERVGDASRQAD